MLTRFKMANLDELDGGKAVLMFEHLVKTAVIDCMDRPADPKSRRVTLQLDLVPVLEPCGDCAEIKGKLRAKATLPEMKTKEYSFGARVGGMLVFNPDSLDNARQSTLLDDPDDD